MSDPYAIKKAIGSDSTAELNAKISQLHKLVLKTKLPGEFCHSMRIVCLFGALLCR